MCNEYSIKGSVMRKYILPIAAVLAIAGVSSANAAQTSANFQSRINILSACVVTAAPLDFGNVGVIAGGETATSAVAVNCSAGTAYTISFSSSAAVSAYSGTMINGAESVAYSAALSGAGGVGPGSYTIAGVLPAQATPSSKLYVDNRTVYVTY